MRATAELKPVDAKTFVLVLKEPFGLVLEALGKVGSNVPFMMPKRVAETDPNKQIDDYTGSGPFIFKKDEWKAGEKVVYVRNPKYKPRAEPPSMMAGGKVAKVDRVEWIAIPDRQQRGQRADRGRDRPDRGRRRPTCFRCCKADKNVALFGWNALGGQSDHALQPPASAVQQREGAPGGDVRPGAGGLHARPGRRSRDLSASATRRSSAARRTARSTATC